MTEATTEGTIMYKMRAALAFVCIFIAVPAQSACYITSSYSGYMAVQGKSFELDKDGYENRVFVIDIDGEKADITPGAGICTVLDLQTMACAYGASGSSAQSYEIWAVYPDSNKAIHVKIRHGYGVYSFLSGAGVFIGKIDREC